MNYREAWANGEIEAGTLVDAIEEQAREIERLQLTCNDIDDQNDRIYAELAALKAQSSGVVDAQRLLDWNRAQPEPRQIVIGREYQVAEARAALSSPVSAGGVDERAAFEVWAVENHFGTRRPFANSNNYASGYTDFCWKAWQARAALSSPVSAGDVLNSSECACGDQYPANSYGAGFMAANNGVCENCDTYTAPPSPDAELVALLEAGRLAIIREIVKWSNAACAGLPVNVRKESELVARIDAKMASLK